MKAAIPSPKSRTYRMRRRAETVDLTRQRITEAAARLHTTVGPSATSMSAVAEAAGVTRLTLYRHFPSKDALFGACMGHWRSLHPPPDPDAWRDISSFRARAVTAIDELYGWYAQNGDELYPIYRDAAFTPQSNQHARRATNDRIVAAMLGDSSPPRGPSWASPEGGTWARRELLDLAIANRRAVAQHRGSRSDGAPVRPCRRRG